MKSRLGRSVYSVFVSLFYFKMNNEKLNTLKKENAITFFKN